MINEIFLTMQLTYALTLNPKRLADVSWTFRVALLVGVILCMHNYMTPPLLDTGYFVFNEFAAGLKILVLLTVVFLLTTVSRNGSELPFMVTLATLFLLLLLSSNHFIATFFAVVGFSLNLYILVLFDASFAAAREAGIKYYYLSTFSSGLILFGVFLLFLLTGSAEFGSIANTLTLQTLDPHILLFAITFLLFGFFFKLSAFPGHQWAPEVYEGSPAVIMGYFMIPVKVAVLGSVMRFLTAALAPALSLWQPLLLLAVVGSLIWGCFGAFYELKLRRFLAYASINQMGFLLLGVACGTAEGYRATLLYLILYVMMSIAFLNIFLHTYREQDSQTPAYLTDFRGLASTNRAASWTLTVTLLSMAGIPPLAGFFGKYYLLLHAVEQGLYLAAVIGLVTSLASTYYYLRLVKMIWFEGAGRPPHVASAQGPLSHFLEATLWGFGLALSPALLFSSSLISALTFTPLHRVRPAFLLAPVAPQASLGLLAIGAAACVILLPNPIHNLLALIVAFLSMVCIYIAVQAQFLAFTFLIVYVGAVAILFLFVVMLLNVKELSTVVVRGRTPAFLAMFPLFLQFCYDLMAGLQASLIVDRTRTPYADFTGYVAHEYQDVAAFAGLYGQHAGLFTTMTLILLATMIAVIVIARPTLTTLSAFAIFEEQQIVAMKNMPNVIRFLVTYVDTLPLMWAYGMVMLFGCVPFLVFFIVTKQWYCTAVVIGYMLSGYKLLVDAAEPLFLFICAAAFLAHIAFAGNFKQLYTTTYVATVLGHSVFTPVISWYVSTHVYVEGLNPAIVPFICTSCFGFAVGLAFLNSRIITVAFYLSHLIPLFAAVHYVENYLVIYDSVTQFTSVFTRGAGCTIRVHMTDAVVDRAIAAFREQNPLSHVTWDNPYLRNALQGDGPEDLNGRLGTLIDFSPGTKARYYLFELLGLGLFVVGMFALSAIFPFSIP